MARHGALAVATGLACALVAAVGLAACGTAAVSQIASATRPGAELRALNALAARAERVSFEATYRYTVPTSAATSRTEQLRIARQGSRTLLSLGGTTWISRGGDAAYVCRAHACVADASMPEVQPPALFWQLQGLVEGASFWSSTQGYPITRADLAVRGVRLAFAAGNYAGRRSTCVTLTYSRRDDVHPLRFARSQRWCVDAQGLIDAWSSGRRALVLGAFGAPTAATFSLPAPAVYPKAAIDRDR